MEPPRTSVVRQGMRTILACLPAVLLLSCSLAAPALDSGVVGVDRSGTPGDPAPPGAPSASEGDTPRLDGATAASAAASSSRPATAPDPATAPAGPPVLSASSASSTGSPSSEPAAAAPDPPVLSAAEARARLAASAAPRRVVVDKSERTLTLHLGDEVLSTWPVGLGRLAPEDPDKVRQGDHATPEGTFRVVTHNGQSRFHRFLGLDYPLPEDADRGLRRGLVTDAQAAAIREAHAAGRRPPWDTPLGGAIGLHGGGGGGDWTWGCVAVSDEQVEVLFEHLPHGAEVVIRR